jgi:hypothetical protein
MGIVWNNNRRVRVKNQRKNIRKGLNNTVMRRVVCLCRRWVWIDNWKYWILSALNYKALLRYHQFTQLYSSLARSESFWSAVSSQALWHRLPAADVPLPLGSRSVAVT